MIADYIQWAVAAVITAAMLFEIKKGRIPNGLTILPFLLFAVLLVVAEDRTALYWQAALALGVFVCGLVIFAVGGSGAGAVKLATGVALFVPLSKAGYAALVFVLAFIVSIFVFGQARKFFGSDASRVYVLSHAVLPLSFSIGLAGLAGMFVI